MPSQVIAATNHSSPSMAFEWSFVFIIMPCFSHCHVIQITNTDSDSLGLGRGLRFCISDKRPGDAMLLVPRTCL